MDSRAIGVFDSGLGGLTAVKELRRVLPNENIIYFGDTARVPYGNRSRDTILKYTRQDIRFLLTQDVKVIVVACGTVSTVALPLIADEYHVPLVGVVYPAVRRAASATKNGKIGLIATQASVRSRAYVQAMHSINPSIQVISEACPLLVPLVEVGRISPDDVVTRTVLEEYLYPMVSQGIDTLILGCTHYPLLTDAIKSVIGRNDITLINPGAEAANFVTYARDWQRTSSDTRGTTSYFVSDNVEGFTRISSLFLQESVGKSVGLVDMDSIL